MARLCSSFQHLDMTVSVCSGTMLEAWLGYIKMEIEKGNLNEARSIYRRCYTKRFSGSGSEVYNLMIAMS